MMGGSILMECLTTLVHPDEADFQSPFILTLSGAKWSVATDRVWVVGVRGAGPWLPWETSSERMERVQRLLNIVPPSDAVTVPVAEVLAWTGPPADDMLEGRFCGVMVDTKRVASLLTGLPFTKVLVWDASELAHMPAVAFSAGDRWRAILAGLADDCDPQVDPFDPTVSRKLFDAVMSLED